MATSTILCASLSRYDEIVALSIGNYHRIIYSKLFSDLTVPAIVCRSFMPPSRSGNPPAEVADVRDRASTRPTEVRASMPIDTQRTRRCRT